LGEGLKKVKFDSRTVGFDLIVWSLEKAHQLRNHEYDNYMLNSRKQIENP